MGKQLRLHGHTFLAGVLVGTLLGAVLGWWAARPEPLMLEIPTPPPPPTPVPVTVYVNGAVLRPGVYTLPPGSRVADAIQAAGGLTDNADTVTLNLAQRLADEAYIYVPARTSPQRERSTPQRPPSPTVTFPVDINTASVEALMALPGIGPTMAERIIANRPYGSVEDLLRVRGIGPATLEKLRPYITVGP